jgi:hypothetical protein
VVAVAAARGGGRAPLFRLVLVLVLVLVAVEDAI